MRKVCACFRAVALIPVLVLAFGMFWLGTAAADASAYLEAVRSGALFLEQGRTAEAKRAFQAARDLDMNDVLACVGLGYCLDVEGKATEARGELELALKLDGKSQALPFAWALIEINHGRPEVAIRYLETACRDGKASDAMRVALAYARCASGDYAGATETLAALPHLKTLAPAHRAMARLIGGTIAYVNQDYARAVEAFREALDVLPPAHFFETRPRRRAPLLAEARTERTEPVALVSAPSLGPQVRTRSGIVRLYLDPFQFPGAQYAFFLVDGKCVYSTNAQPFRYDWDTRRVRNGYHKVVVRAECGTGQVLGQTEEVLLIYNEGVVFPPNYDTQAYAETDAALVRALALQPDPLTAHYLLGRSLQHVGNSAEAAVHLERTMAQDPEFGQARQALKTIYAARNGQRVRCISWVPTASRKVALTFDDGPHPLYTPPLLDLLDRYQARCTMFLVGVQAEAYPEIVREIVEKGHEIANHTYSHPNLQTLDRAGVEMELLRGRSVLQRISGKRVELFRPPGGRADQTTEAIAFDYGFTTVYWDLFDSWLQRFDEATVLQRLIGSIKPGSIVLLHNGSNKTAPILEPLFEELTRQGYRFVTVSELLRDRSSGVLPPADVPHAPELRDEDDGGSLKLITAPANPTMLTETPATGHTGRNGDSR